MKNWDLKIETTKCTIDEDYESAIRVCKLLDIKLNHKSFAEVILFSNLKQILKREICLIPIIFTQDKN